MDVRYINPFVVATVTLFDRMLCCRLERGALAIHSLQEPYRGVSGIIELSGEVQATIVLNLSRQVALAASRVWLEETVHDLNSDVVDVVGELVNIIGGQARSKFRRSNISMGLPRVVKEHMHFITFPAHCQPIRIPFQSPWGPLSVDVGMTAAKSVLASAM